MRVPPRPAAALAVAAAVVAAAADARATAGACPVDGAPAPPRPNGPDLLDRLEVGGDAAEAEADVLVPGAALSLLQLGGGAGKPAAPASALPGAPAASPGGRAREAALGVAASTSAGRGFVMQVVRWFRGDSFELGGPLFDEGDFFHDAPPIDWAILAATVVGALALDWAVLQGLPATFGWYVILVFFWIFVAIAFNALIWLRLGSQQAGYFAVGYLIEWILSLDNLMLIQMMFALLHTPAIQIPKSLFFGIVFSILTRMVLCLLIVWVFDSLNWIRYPLAALLIWSGIQGARSHQDDVALEDVLVVRGLKWLLGERFTGRYSADGSVLTWGSSSGGVQATMLFVAIVMVCWVDLVFSLDSVAVKVSIIPNGYIAYSSSVLAMFGLRAMFFVMTSMLEMFDFLQYGLCIILVLVALQLLLEPWIYVTPICTVLVMAAVFVCSVAASVLKNHGKAPDNGQPQEAPVELGHPQHGKVTDNGQPQENHAKATDNGQPHAGQSQEAH